MVSPRNSPESAETASFDDEHVNAPRGSLIVEIAPGPQNGESNVPESAKTASADERQVSAP